MIYVRWRNGEPRRGRVFPPLPADNPCVGLPCPACGDAITTAAPTQLIAVGPVDPDGEQDHREGRWYAAGAALLHRSCADAMEDGELERLVDELTVIEGAEAVDRG